MCGICGALSLNHSGIKAGSIQKMTNSLAHRGPDDAGYLLYHTGCRHVQRVSFDLNMGDKRFSSRSALMPSLDSPETLRKIQSHDWDLFLGHRRLSILDLSADGHQPMSDLSKNIWISFNGEIYNYKEIRRELSVLGHHFHTETDTEVIIYAYIEWGISCIKKFNGMFAFSLYDNYKKKLFLVRDRYGIKPVYYTVTPGQKKTFVFASEAKSILEYLDSTVQIDCEALMEYMTFQNIFSDRTLYKGIRLLEPGHYICLQLDTADQIKSFEMLSKTCYWDFSFKESQNCFDEREYVEELKRLFNLAIKRQVVSDVEVGSYLSGGMDSAAISCLASQRIPDLKTFTVGFDLNSVSGMEMAFDERHISEYLSYLYKTEHYEMVLKSGDMERCMPRFAWHLEEPRVGQSYPNYYAAKLAGNFVKVVLSGTGGDELFGGYPWRYYRAVVNQDF
jgi:asparagine synthase (glutamine-hydrolysing)